MLERLEEGVSMCDIAEELEFSEGTLLTELEYVRRELSPFANAWKKAKESGNVLPVEKNTKSDEKDTESGDDNGAPY